MKYEQAESLDDLRRQFLNLENVYEIQTSRETGERILAEIAETADREYNWAFDANSSTWYHYPAARHPDEIDVVRGGIKQGLTVSSELEVPPSNNSSHYHIHPDFGISTVLNLEVAKDTTRDYCEAVGQLPTSDLPLSSGLTHNGYMDIRIVTPRGVTIVECLVKKLPPGQKSVDFPDLNIKREQINEFLKKGVNDTILKMLDVMNRRYSGLFKFSYTQFDK
jgi:hypothetical protein